VRLSLKAINAELFNRGIKARLEKGDDYFYFWTGEAEDWLDRTVRVPTLHSLTLDQWMEAFQKLKEQNRKLMQSVAKDPKEKPTQEASARKSRRSP